MLNKRQLDKGITKAIQQFWRTRTGQALKQQSSGKVDQGSRGAVTGGKQMDGFVELMERVIVKSGVSPKCIHTEKRLELPGYFRAEKKWDLLVVDRENLVAAIEFKSQIGPSFGNNFNNRSEEAIGTAQDLWTAFREGGLKSSKRPWLGYLFMLEDCPGSRNSVKVKEPHYSVFPEFKDVGYSQRYQILLTRLVRERLYDGACLLLSSYAEGLRGKGEMIDPELDLYQFVGKLHGHIVGHLANRR